MDLLKFIKSSSPLPWVCIGGFNEVLDGSEHVGVQERSNAQMEGFREAIDVFGLADLGFEGRKWMYEKKVTSGSFCQVRLDRALAIADWIMRYPLAKVQHLIAAASDHVPITLTWRSDEPRSTRKKNFKYEVMWETHENFSPTLVDAWGQLESSTVPDLQRKLKDVSGQLQRWERLSFGNVRWELRKLAAELERLQSDPHRVGPSHAELKIKERIVEHR